MPAHTRVAVLRNAITVAAIRANVKVVVFGAHNTAHADGLFGDLGALRKQADDPAPWLCASLPWSDEAPRFRLLKTWPERSPYSRLGQDVGPSDSDPDGSRRGWRRVLEGDPMKRATLKEDASKACNTKLATVAAISELHDFMSAALATAGTPGGLDPMALKKIGGGLPKSIIHNLPGVPGLGWPGSSVHHFLRAQLFVGLVAEVEGLFAELLREVLCSFPGKIGKPPDGRGVAASATRAELVEELADEEINQALYAKPADYRLTLEKHLGLDRALLEPHWDILVEAKARRDLGVHNAWTWNRVYGRKAGSKGHHPGREGNMWPTANYFAETVAAFTAMVAAIQAALDKNFAKCTRAHVFREMWDLTLGDVVEFERAWNIDSPDMVRPVDGFSWAWSGSEQLLFEFFQYIYLGRRQPADFPAIYRRWSGARLAMVDEWLSWPFYF